MMELLASFSSSSSSTSNVRLIIVSSGLLPSFLPFCPLVVLKYSLSFPVWPASTIVRCGAQARKGRGGEETPFQKLPKQLFLS